MNESKNEHDNVNQRRVRLVSDGTSLGTKVYLDGVEVSGIQKLSWSIGVRDKSKLEMSVKRVPIDIELDMPEEDILIHESDDVGRLEPLDEDMPPVYYPSRHEVRPQDQPIFSERLFLTILAVVAVAALVVAVASVIYWLSVR